jgi:hypothetical protein
MDNQYLTQDEVGLIPIVTIDCVTHWVLQIAQFVAPATDTVSRVTSQYHCHAHHPSWRMDRRQYDGFPS